MMLSNLNLLATAPGGVARLRELILTLAVQGKLVPQDPADEPASVLLRKIRAEKDRLIAEGKIKKDKPLAAIAEEEKPFELPVGWEWVRLGSLLDRLSNGYSGEQSKFPSQYPLSRIETISAATVNYERVGYCTKLSEAEVEKYRLLQGDILLSHINSDIHLGKTALIKEDRLLIHGINLLLLRPSVFCSSEYINLAITQRRFNGYFLSIAQHAIGQASINQSKLSSTLVSLPPAAEQSRIVTRVEELMRLCDALEAKGQLEATQHAQLLSTLLGTLTASTTPEELANNWQRVAQHLDLLLDRPEAIDALEQTLLQLAVRGLLVPQDPADEPASVLLQKIRAEKDRLIAAGQIKRDKPLPPVTDEEKPFELPVGWEWVRFGALPFSTSIGLDRGRGQQGDSFAFPYFKMNNIANSGGVTYAAMARVNATEEELEKFKLKVGDFLFNTRNSRELVGKTCVIDHLPEENTIFNNNILVSRFHGKVEANFVDIWFRSPLGQTRLDQIKSATTNVCAIYQGNLFEFLCPIPPLAEQSRIVTRVTQLRRLCADLRQRLAEREVVQARLAEALVQQVA